ncbi:hypothetical protein [Nonomuraea sp. NPDC049784]|uniref:hypothetical protein n=1 Tax=Nonomuraea sp. NPDC049784 TaxID=3154361 RepID=UPI0033CB403C
MVSSVVGARIAEGGEASAAQGGGPPMYWAPHEPWTTYAARHSSALDRGLPPRPLLFHEDAELVITR